MKNLLRATILLDPDNKRGAVVCRKTEATAHQPSRYCWYVEADGLDCELCTPLRDGLAGAKAAAIASWGNGSTPWEMMATWL